MNIETIPISDIILDPAYQVRESLSAETRERYKSLIEDGVKFPLLKVGLFPDGRYRMLAGFHRFGAYVDLGRDSVEAEVYEVNEVEALKIALAGNSDHGLQMKAADFRRAVELVYSNPHMRMSERSVAQLIGCGKSLVNKYKMELAHGGRIVLPDTIEGADGREQPACRPPQTTAHSVGSAPAVAKPPVVRTTTNQEVEVVESDPFDLDEPTDVEARMAQHNRAIDLWCRRHDELFKDIPTSEWVDEGRLRSLTIDANRLVGSLRSWKADRKHSACNGDGCDMCHNTGFLPREAARQYEDR